MSDANGAFADNHVDMLKASGISLDRALARGYRTVYDASQLSGIGIAKAGSQVPGLLVPQLRVDGSTWGYQYRPDSPRTNTRGKIIKYETPIGQRNGIDVPVGVGPMLGNPYIPLWVTEGVKKADCGAAHKLCIVALPGVWSWRGRNSIGGKIAVGDWNDIALNGRRVILAFDGDVARKPEVQAALASVAEYLRSKDAIVEYLHLPDTDSKTGLDDYLMDEHTVEDLWRLVKPTPPSLRTTSPPDEAQALPVFAEPVNAIPLSKAHEVFRRWLGQDYDVAALDVCLAAAAVEKMNGDPLWVLIVSGPGNAKTETVQAFHGAGGVVISSISSQAALLSATPKRDCAKDATGGLLRQLGERGLLIIKDVTSILSMNAITREEVLSALREVYDGNWVRNVGAEGGRSIPWSGRIGVIGAVTTAWDSHHAVIAKMGDRFILLRIDSTETDPRMAAAFQSILNTGREADMRAELAATVTGVLAGMNPEPITLTDDEIQTIIRAANLATLARTAVEYDYQGRVIDVHQPEMPTRCAKQLAQVVRGAVAIGMDRTEALRLAIRCARDSMPPLRRTLIDDVAQWPRSSTNSIRKRVDKPYSTVDRQLQSLHMLRVFTVEEQEYGADGRSRWFYTLVSGIDPDSLNPDNVYQKSERRGVLRDVKHVENQGFEHQTPPAPIYLSGELPANESVNNGKVNLSQNGHQSLCVDCEQAPVPGGHFRCSLCRKAQQIIEQGYER